ncbi:MAG TPA: hypothetical protein VHR84_01880 [Terriglobales bacterium]|jgi:hypothetical protein|nr:hypothetical protein [Terriglobales bacterium]
MKAGLGLFPLLVALTGCGKPAHNVDVSCKQMIEEQLKSAAEHQEKWGKTAGAVTAKFNELRKLHDPEVDEILNRQTWMKAGIFQSARISHGPCLPLQLHFVSCVEVRKTTV